MKKSKKLLAAMLALGMVATSFAGCGAAAPSSAGTSGQGTPGEESPKEIVFPLEEKVTLTMWAQFDLNAGKVMSDYNGSRTFEELEKRTNVHIEFIAPAQGQQQEQFNLMLASREYPDMVMGGVQWYQGGGDKSIEDGVFMDLTDLVDKYAPNYTAVLEANPEAMKEVKSDTGKMAAVYPIMKEDNLCWYGPVFRKDWLEETGLDVPQTIAEWEEVLTAMKENHPDAVPLVFDYAGLPSVRFKDNGTDTYGVFISAFGIGPNLYRDGDTVKFGPANEKFDAYLEVMNRWYEKGLIDKDFPARDRDGISSLIASGQAGCIVASIDYANTLFSSQGIEFVAAPYPVMNEGDTCEYRANDWWASPTGNAVSVTTQCENPEIAVAWLDYAFSKEGEMLYNFGVEGETYTMEDGQPVFTDLVMNNPDVPLESAIFKYKMHIFPQLRWGAKSNPSTLRNENILKYKQAWTDQAGVDMVMLPVSLTADEAKEYSKIMSAIDVYRNETTLKFIMGIEPLENFDSYLEQLDKMGINDALAIQQAALDRFNAR